MRLTKMLYFLVIVPCFASVALAQIQKGAINFDRPITGLQLPQPQTPQQPTLTRPEQATIVIPRGTDLGRVGSFIGDTMSETNLRRTCGAGRNLKSTDFSTTARYNNYVTFCQNQRTTPIVVGRPEITVPGRTTTTRLPTVTTRSSTASEFSRPSTPIANRQLVTSAPTGRPNSGPIRAATVFIPEKKFPTLKSIPSPVVKNNNSVLQATVANKTEGLSSLIVVADGEKPNPNPNPNPNPSNPLQNVNSFSLDNNMMQQNHQLKAIPVSNKLICDKYFKIVHKNQGSLAAYINNMSQEDKVKAKQCCDDPQKKEEFITSTIENQLKVMQSGDPAALDILNKIKNKKIKKGLTLINGQANNINLMKDTLLAMNDSSPQYSEVTLPDGTITRKLKYESSQRAANLIGIAKKMMDDNGEDVRLKISNSFRPPVPSQSPVLAKKENHLKKQKTELLQNIETILNARSKITGAPAGGEIGGTFAQHSSFQDNATPAELQTFNAEKKALESYNLYCDAVIKSIKELGIQNVQSNSNQNAGQKIQQSSGDSKPKLTPKDLLPK